MHGAGRGRAGGLNSDHARSRSQLPRSPHRAAAWHTTNPTKKEPGHDPWQLNTPGHHVRCARRVAPQHGAKMGQDQTLGKFLRGGRRNRSLASFAQTVSVTRSEIPSLSRLEDLT